MSLTIEEREKVDALKRHQIIFMDHMEKYRILELADKEFSGITLTQEELDELAALSVEDRAAVDLVKLDLQAELDFKVREAELLTIALGELGL